MNFILLQILVVPLIAVPIVYVLGQRLGVKVGWISAASLLYATLLTILVAVGGGGTEFYTWQPIGYFGLRADGLSIPILFTISLLSFVISIYSMPYMHHKIGGEKTAYGLYYALYLLYAIGMLGTVLATNLIEFYIFFEIMLIPSYFLIAEWGYGERDKISMMYFMWTHVGALTLLAGILATGFLVGTFDLIAPAGAAIITEAKIAGDLRFWITVAMIVGFLIKMAAFGFHIWLPYAHAEAPTPISALLSPAMIGIGGYAIVRIISTILPGALMTITAGLAIWALITMIYGGAMALVQDDIKRLLAYSSVSQMGYILLGIASFEPLGISGSMFHYVSHGTGKGILFMVAGAIILQAHGLRSISKMGGLASRMPVTTVAAMIGFMAIFGAPPTNGFISEIMIFAGAFQVSLYEKLFWRLILTIAALAATALTAGYSLWTIKRVFFGPLPDGLREVKEAPATVTGPLLCLAFATTILGIYPEFITGQLVPFAKQLVGR